jgi:hypothetical protein
MVSLRLVSLHPTLSDIELYRFLLLQIRHPRNRHRNPHTSYPDQIFLTNQKSSRTAAASTFDTQSPAGMSAGFHEYRFDWLKGATKFYIDGKYVGAMKKNVPTVPGSMVW